jgi:hypothetical protein
MQSPFVTETAVAVDAQAPILDAPNLDKLETLIAIGVQAKLEAERQKAIYDSTRDQVCAILRNLGTNKVQTSNGEARLKETRSGWQFSEATLQLAEQLKIQQAIEKKKNIAVATKVTLSADLFA